MANLDILRRRFSNQHLARPQFDRPAEMVTWLGAVQSQDYPAAKWALAQRLKGATDALLDQAFNDGAILRTHVMRPTWHFVAPADIRWLLALTAPRVRALLAYYGRRLEIDAALVKRSQAVLTKTLQGGRQFTRPELTTALKKGGINQTGRGLPNSAGGDGGGIYDSSYMTVTLTNVTLADNSVDIGHTGGGIANTFGTVYLKNSLLALNRTTGGPTSLEDCSGTLTSLGYNAILEPFCTITPTVGDQFFLVGITVAPLANNGGPTLTDALPPGSLAIDAGDNSACPSTDQRGFKRPVFGGTDLRCDVGAFELYRFGVRLPAIVR